MVEANCHPSKAVESSGDKERRNSMFRRMRARRDSPQKTRADRSLFGIVDVFQVHEIGETVRDKGADQIKISCVCRPRYQGKEYPTA